MDIKKIKNLAKILEESQLTELTLQEDNISVTLKKEQKIINQAPEQFEIKVPHTATPQPVSTTSVPHSPEEKPQQPEGNIQKSPMVATFYRQPAPDKPPFIKEGDIVKKGDVLCVLEAMKVMNQIKSEYDGKISKICVENESAVEYGQDLFIITAQ